MNTIRDETKEEEEERLQMKNTILFKRITELVKKK